QNRASPFLGLLPGFFPIPDGPRWIRIVDDWARGEAKGIFLARGAVLLSGENKMRRLSAGELCSPHIQHAQNSTVQRDCASGSCWRLGLADRQNPGHKVHLPPA